MAHPANVYVYTLAFLCRLLKLYFNLTLDFSGRGVEINKLRAIFKDKRW